MSRFDDILAEAMREYQRTGYTSFERLQMWESRLRDALQGQMMTDAEIKAKIDTGYGRMFASELRGLNSEIERFTVDRIKPSLREELNRRIKLSADLIVLERDESIERTLRRFGGFVTSGDFDKREVKETVKKAYKDFDYRERRLFNDQGHKMIANLNAMVAEQGGAIAARWSSRYKALNYNYRPEHKQLDGKLFKIRDNWAIKAGLMKPGGDYHDTVEQPAVAVNCRCSWVYIYSINKLPDDWLTEKGKEQKAATKGKAEAISKAIFSQL